MARNVAWPSSNTGSYYGIKTTPTNDSIAFNTTTSIRSSAPTGVLSHADRQKQQNEMAAAIAARRTVGQQEDETTDGCCIVM